MKMHVGDLAEIASDFEISCGFGETFDDRRIKRLEKRGFADAAIRSEWCIIWLWAQWISGVTTSRLTENVSLSLRRGISLRDYPHIFRDKPLHDLLLIVSACLGGTESDVIEVAECVMDTSGDGNLRASDINEVHLCAWTGMFKYWVLGDHEKAASEAEAIWKSRPHPSIKGAAASLVNPWLARDWDEFRKQQRKDFSRRWAWGGKYKIVTEKKTKRVIDFRSLVLVKERWCWAHCAMAMLAAREGIEVETDEFWFPPTALLMQPTVIPLPTES